MTAGRDPYRTLGNSYATRRRPDPRIARLIGAALGDARTIVNVGAGTGSYEPADRRVTAVEPSAVMIAQRPAGAAPVMQGAAECLPFADQTFDAALAVLTVHHWASAAAGLAELRRVARRQVVLTWDPQVFARFWVVADYLPEIAERESTLACLAAVSRELARGGQQVTVREVPVPGDCVDGFLGAYWRRPQAYLSAATRAAMSSIALLDQGQVTAAAGRLAADLTSGRWHKRHGHLLARSELDLGYRLVATGP
ncbi:MAG TPA: class I SAM-dependent methyltransferase [Streptosporangiaceae bacterium]|jgi:SAM-dependent methyltransferase